MNRSIALGLVVALLGLTACSKEKKAEPESNATNTAAAKPAQTAGASAASDAKKAFTSKCVVCHGATGNGDGAGSAALDPKPRKFSDPEWQASVTDDHIKKVIVQGGLAVGKSATMPGNPDLKDKPEVVAELVKIIRGFKK